MKFCVLKRKMNPKKQQHGLLSIWRNRLHAFLQSRAGLTSELYISGSFHLQISWLFIRRNMVKHCSFHGLEMGLKDFLRLQRKYQAQPVSELTSSFRRSACEENCLSPCTHENSMERVGKKLVRETILYFLLSIQLAPQGVQKRQSASTIYIKRRGGIKPDNRDVL